MKRMNQFLATKFIWISLPLLVLYAFCAQGKNEIDWDALNRGEIIVEEVRTESGIPGVRAFFIVHASRKTIWSTLIDYDNFPKFFNGIDKMEVVEQDENGARIEFWVNAVLTDLHYILYRNYLKPGYHLTWQRESGDLKAIQGSWQIIDTDNAETKLLIYESYVDIGFSLITWAIRQGAKHKANEMGCLLRDWLENK